MSALWLLSKVAVETAFNMGEAREMCERFDAEVTVDGKPWSFKNFTFITAGTMETFGFGFRPLYRARTKPGQLQIMGCSTTPRGVLTNFPRFFLSKPSPSKYYEDSMGHEAVIKLEKPQSYMIDGDVVEPTDTIKITCGPRLTIIVR